MWSERGRHPWPVARAAEQVRQLKIVAGDGTNIGNDRLGLGGGDGGYKMHASSAVSWGDGRGIVMVLRLEEGRNWASLRRRVPVDWAIAWFTYCNIDRGLEIYVGCFMIWQRVLDLTITLMGVLVYAQMLSFFIENTYLPSREMLEPWLDLP